MVRLDHDIKTVEIIHIGQQTDKKYTFLVPDFIDLYEGDMVRVNTKKGITVGVCVEDSKYGRKYKRYPTANVIDIISRGTKYQELTQYHSLIKEINPADMPKIIGM